MKKNSVACEKTATTDGAGSTPSLFCGAADPETNERLHMPTTTTCHKDDKPLDLESVRTIM